MTKILCPVAQIYLPKYTFYIKISISWHYKVVDKMPKLIVAGSNGSYELL